MAKDNISTHTLRKEGDTINEVRRVAGQPISTHTLRKEGDQLIPAVVDAVINFNPHPPQGG